MNRQRELFTEFENADIKPRAFTKGLLPERTFSFNFGYEKLILAAIGFIVITSVVFALGFECGRNGARPKREGVQRPLPQEAPYTILVATFRSNQFARQEVEKLKAKGFPAVIFASNGLYKVCVGEYADMKSALQVLNALKKFYTDCSIRKR